MIFTVVLDLILIAVLLLGCYVGFRRGFVKCVARSAVLLASLSVAMLLASGFSSVFIEPLLEGSLTSQIKGYLIENCPEITSGNGTEELPTVLKISAAICGVELSSDGGASLELIVDKLSSPFTRLVSVFLSFIILYFLLKLLFGIAASLIDSFLSVTPLALPNRIVGSLFGVYLSACLACGVTAAFDFFINLPIFDGYAYSFEGGVVYGFFSGFNPVSILLDF